MTSISAAFDTVAGPGPPAARRSAGVVAWAPHPHSTWLHQLHQSPVPFFSPHISCHISDISGSNMVQILKTTQGLAVLHWGLRCHRAWEAYWWTSGCSMISVALSNDFKKVCVGVSSWFSHCKQWWIYFLLCPRQRAKGRLSKMQLYFSSLLSLQKHYIVTLQS